MNKYKYFLSYAFYKNEVSQIGWCVHEINSKMDCEEIIQKVNDRVKSDFGADNLVITNFILLNEEEIKDAS
jgi:hypothetical protein